MEKKMNTIVNFEFCDGTTTELTLTFYALLQLKNKNRAAYNRYNEAMQNSSKGTYDEFNMLGILYAAYVCAHIDDEEVMPEMEFIKKCGSNRVAVGEAVKDLVQPKKQ